MQIRFFNRLFYIILFCKQWCGVVSVSAVRKQCHDHFSFIFRFLCILDGCIEGSTGGNTDQDSLEIGILLSSDSSQAMVNRVSGFLEYWAKYAPEKWTINQDIRLNGGDMENAQTDVAALLSNNRQIKGLYGCNNTSTKGIAAVLMKTNRQDIVMAGFDLAKETASLIRNPDYHGITLLQKQDQMAYEGMLSLDRQIRGETSEQKYIDTGVLLVDRDYLLENEPNER